MVDEWERSTAIHWHSCSRRTEAVSEVFADCKRSIKSNCHLCMKCMNNNSRKLRIRYFTPVSFTHGLLTTKPEGKERMKCSKPDIEEKNGRRISLQKADVEDN